MNKGIILIFLIFLFPLHSNAARYTTEYQSNSSNYSQFIETNMGSGPNFIQSMSFQFSGSYFITSDTSDTTTKVILVTFDVRPISPSDKLNTTYISGYNYVVKIEMALNIKFVSQFDSAYFWNFAITQLSYRDKNNNNYILTFLPKSIETSGDISVKYSFTNNSYFVNIPVPTYSQSNNTQNQLLLEIIWWILFTLISLIILRYLFRKQFMVKEIKTWYSSYKHKKSEKLMVKDVINSHIQDDEKDIRSFPINQFNNRLFPIDQFNSRLNSSFFKRNTNDICKVCGTKYMRNASYCHECGAAKVK